MQAKINVCCAKLVALLSFSLYWKFTLVISISNKLTYISIDRWCTTVIFASPANKTSDPAKRIRMRKINVIFYQLLYHDMSQNQRRTGGKLTFPLIIPTAYWIIVIWKAWCCQQLRLISVRLIAKVNLFRELIDLFLQREVEEDGEWGLVV